jgi:acyl phosphate:glycerol-3-phosphate acyltransferase
MRELRVGRGAVVPILAGPMDRSVVALALIVMGYLVGSLPMGVIVARLTGGRDPRTVGSGRTGGTNALRAMGPGRALTIGLLDVAKGAVPVIVARLAGADELVQALAGVAAVLGAWRSVFLNFHGGRGVASAVGAMAVIAPLVVILSMPVFFGVIWLSKYVSLGSLVGTAAAAGILLMFVVAGINHPISLVYGIAAVAIVWIAHLDNIQRLIHGQERKFVFGDREPN